MLLLAVPMIILQAAWSPIVADSQPQSLRGPVREERFAAARAAVAPADTVFEYSKAYYRRLDVHRAASYTMLPLFALQMIAGNQLYRMSDAAPDWAKVGHRVGATGAAALFTLNTVTGLQNLYEARPDPEGRGRRTLHAVMMLAADAGFIATGVLSEKAEGSADDRRMHRTVALSSIGIATIGYLIQGGGFR